MSPNAKTKSLDAVDVDGVAKYEAQDGAKRVLVACTRPLARSRGRPDRSRRLPRPIDILDVMTLDDVRTLTRHLLHGHAERTTWQSMSPLRSRRQRWRCHWTACHGG